MIRFRTHNTTYYIYLCTFENDILTTNIGVFHIRKYRSAHSHPSFVFVTFFLSLLSVLFCITHILLTNFSIVLILTDRTMQYCTYRTST
jgi:hypothetical protein